MARSWDTARGTGGAVGILVAGSEQLLALTSPTMQGGPSPEDEIPQQTAHTRCIARPRFDVGLPGPCSVRSARCPAHHGYRTAHRAPRMRCRIEPMIEAAHPCGALS